MPEESTSRPRRPGELGVGRRRSTAGTASPATIGGGAIPRAGGEQVGAATSSCDVAEAVDPAHPPGQPGAGRDRRPGRPGSRPARPGRRGRPACRARPGPRPGQLGGGRREHVPPGEGGPRRDRPGGPSRSSISTARPNAPMAWSTAGQEAIVRADQEHGGRPAHSTAHRPAGRCPPRGRPPPGPRPAQPGHGPPRTRAPAATSWAGTRWVRSTTAGPGAMAAITRWTSPDELVVQAEVAETRSAPPRPRGRRRRPRPTGLAAELHPAPGPGMRSADLGVLLGQVAVHVIRPDAVGTPDPHRRQLPGLDQPVHRHVGHPQLVGHLADGDEPRSIVVAARLPPFSER